MFWSPGTGLVGVINGEVVWYVLRIPDSPHEHTREQLINEQHVI
ncbi:hypothetical protein F383_28563 [Gossypium arboreum]|uniref:Uncharacterized protein n=1 Tax=Gossypium arboreum TaxID=29729 RepID=A0A0B0PIR4_GOSAR|nr:hypothetical protein F383_28563 [Gossypium arboreum]